ncbi:MULTISPECIES: hypothetical protein [Snodgrassella]|uniref:hypothetical protein n=1 Tax=Snodgrassella TaxID=1193515 RepID=UPI000C1DE7DE|nr:MULTISPECIES: hypothetical protein [Snodgrassella]MBI0165026.1 hypothetical protein [Snodgrassella sp. M0351]PIT32768.1 hypothetical protein BHC42_08305 [Snodgrassella alvi]PIT33163.1 hypothetical protein BHC50_05255 [Snodgrassella alvi]WLT03553.1 hypothetical protein RAM23_06935 [Snodgrassella alvi]
MSRITYNASFIESGGRPSQIPISIDIYKSAADSNLSVPAYLQQEYGQKADKNYANGSVFSQVMASLNAPIDVKGKGFRAMKLGNILDGTFRAAVTQDAKKAITILAPAAILSIVEENKTEDYTDTLSMFEKLIAIDKFNSSDTFAMPIFDLSNADKRQASAIGQSAISYVGRLTISRKSHTIPTFSYGLKASDEALKACSINAITIHLRSLRKSLASNLVRQQLNSLINGNRDMDIKPLPVVPINKYDSEAGNGVLTHKAYMKWLWNDRGIYQVDYVLCNEDDYFRIIERKGCPNISLEQMAYATKPINKNIVEPQIFILNEGVVPPGTLVGIDSRYAIARLKYSQANFDAVEEMVMRNGKALYFDERQVLYRHDEEAFKVTTLN